MLSPCPFCGRYPIVVRLAGSHESRWLIRCPDAGCPASGTPRWGYEEAEEAWNRRYGGQIRITRDRRL